MPRPIASLSATACLALTLATAPAAHAAAAEPSEADILALAERDVARANLPIVEYHQRLGKGDVPADMLVRLNAVRKKACQPAGEADAWQCEVEMDMTVPNGGFRSRTVMLRLGRTADGWQASRSR